MMLQSPSYSLHLIGRVRTWLSIKYYMSCWVDVVIIHNLSYKKIVQSFTHMLVVDKHSYIDSAEAINFNFSDTGLFGVKVRGAAD